MLNLEKLKLLTIAVITRSFFVNEAVIFLLITVVRKKSYGRASLVCRKTRTDESNANNVKIGMFSKQNDNKNSIVYSFQMCCGFQGLNYCDKL